jgi:hypothetical protein
MYNLGDGPRGPYKSANYFGGGLMLRRRRSEDLHPNYTLLYYSRSLITLTHCHHPISSVNATRHLKIT